ncbi:MAG: winged helix-turn-helix transcriptional regulator [Treponema sp.]|nr:winged helix-turn-helix transcriptional regulator [Treponema sp.]
MIDKSEVERARTLFNSCSPLFIALGDEVRQKLILDIGTVESVDENGINVTNLSAMSKLSRPAISHHLKVLKDCGLIKPNKVGTSIYYKLNLGDYLDNVSELVSCIRSLLNLQMSGVSA